MGIWDNFKRGFRKGMAGNAANPPANPPANAAGNQPAGPGSSTFSPRILIQQHGSRFLWILLFIAIAGFLISLMFFGIRNTTLFIINNIFPIILGIAFLIIIYLGFKDEDKHAGRFIAGAFIIWAIDLLPAMPYLGKPYAGFEFDLLGTLNANWVAVLTSSIVLIGLGIAAWDSFRRGQFWIFSATLVGLWLVNIFINTYYSNKISLVYLNYAVLGICIICFALAIYHREKLSTEFAQWATFMFMMIVFSFFFVNSNWWYTPRAVLHFFYILAFGFAYSRNKEEKDNAKSNWHLWIPALLLVDFYGYNIISLWFPGNQQLVPLMVLLVIGYCISKSESTYPTMAGTFVIIMFLIFLLPDKLVSAESTQFKEIEGTDYKGFLKQFGEKVKALIENRLDVATAGLYRGNVEKNQYESLGVYFGNIRAADPRFYEYEPITVWGTIRSKTYSDAVIVNFSCYRWNDNRKISADKIIPDIRFPIFTLEEVDTECTFNPKTGEDDRIKPGPNTVTLAASYNFGTDAYLKSYFIDRDRFRANTREDIDPLAQYGIKDKNPVAVFTNGPVEIGMGTGQPLITVSDGYTIKPSIDITLRNREQIVDQDKNIITKWDGRIKNITELILLVPPGIEIPNLANCRKADATDQEKADCPCNVPFDDYDSCKCKGSCEAPADDCRKACIESYAKNDIKSCNDAGCGQCIKECDITLAKCNDECDFLFSAEGEDLQGSYKGYSLDVSSKEFEEYNKDIDTARSFRCRFTPTTAVLDDTPITTRYFRARAKYNYVVENSVQINVNPSPIGGAGINTQDILVKTSVESIGTDVAEEIRNEGFNPDLIMAIAYIETGLRHCCQEGYRGAGSRCVLSDERSCPVSRTITSGTSYGLMQIRYDRFSIRQEVDRRVTRLCSEDQTIFELDCNVKVGIDILKEKYNTYKVGCKESSIYKTGNRAKYKTFFDACDNGITGT